MDTTATKAAIRTRLARLREALAKASLAGFIVPHADENQSEYLPPAAERLAWLTGFDGSAGAAVVLADRAAIFVDGRYTLQVRAQTDTDLFTPEHLIENPPSKWLGGQLRKGDRLGYDPWLMTAAEVKRFTEVCAAAGAEFVAVDENPIDGIWADRPPAPLGQVSLHPLSLAGEEAASKIARLRATVAEKKADAAVISATDSIAWTFNIRGRDIAHNPVPLAFAVLPADGKPTLYLDGRKLSNAVRDALSDLADVREPAELGAGLDALAASHARVLIDPKATADAIAARIRAGGGTIVEGDDPAVLPKARKNAVELAGARRAHVRDGAAMVRFLAWLDAATPAGNLDELGAAAKLAEFRADTARRDGMELVDLSFDTISGAGPNGAIIHYHATPATNRRIGTGSLYLIDSGGQYADGTTDITRTVAIGTPTAEMRDRVTRVLKGHIAIATIRFPAGATGAQIDSFARLALWQAGLDYDHGTGHGIGSFLAVHEGPVSISKRGANAFEPGMILSNEPGYYKPGAFGCRIENLVIVRPPERVPGGDRDTLSFETITLCPIDRRLIDVALLTPAEADWVDAYHAALPGALGHLLDEGERRWLAEATRPLAR